MLHLAKVGCFFKTPISHVNIRFAGYAFINDTDLIQTTYNPEETVHDIIAGIQLSMDTWEGGLRATGGAIVPEKGHWYLVIFKWTNRYWRYCYSKELPAVLSVQDISGNIKELSRLEPNGAKTTLGVNTASDGNLIQQASKMKAASVLWADQMRTGHLNKKDSSISFHSTLWRSLAYPLPAINLSKKQCGEIMYPAIQQLLLSLEICRHFPRSLVFAPMKYLGLGINYLHTTQEIQRLQLIIDHTTKDSDTGKLYKASLEHLILEAGMENDILNLPFIELSFLNTSSLVKSTWQFLSFNNIHLHHDISIPLYSEYERPIMQELYLASLTAIGLKLTLVDAR
jgi:hypothetical protein